MMPLIKNIAEKAGINIIFKQHDSATINTNISERISEIGTGKVDLLFIIYRYMACLRTFKKIMQMLINI
jgi:hypothetical protein